MIEGKSKKRKSRGSDSNGATNGTNGVHAKKHGDEMNGVINGKNQTNKTVNDKQPRAASPSSVSLQSSNLKGTKKESVASEPPKKRRKSVSFAPDTKMQDGAIDDEILDDWDVNETIEGNAMNDSTSTPSEGDTESMKKRKKPKKRKTKSAGLDADMNGKSSDGKSQVNLKSSTLDYLTSFHKDKSNWKFNKARQNHVFKQLFDMDKIPHSYDEALLAYIDGLQSTVARNQLRDRALQIREQEAKDGLEDGIKDTDTDAKMAGGEHQAALNQHDRVSTDEERQKAAYLTALRRHKAMAKWDVIVEEEEDKQLSEEWEARLNRRRRLEKMLQRLGEGKEAVEPKATVDTAKRTENGTDFEVVRVVEKTVDSNGDVTGVKRKRKRKRRTAIPMDDSSSDESSSSSDSDSDAEATVKRLKTETKQAEENETSSSESSDDDDTEDESSSEDEETSSSEDESTSSESESESGSDSDDSDSGSSSSS